MEKSCERGEMGKEVSRPNTYVKSGNVIRTPKCPIHNHMEKWTLEKICSLAFQRHQRTGFYCQSHSDTKFPCLDTQLKNSILNIL